MNLWSNVFLEEPADADWATCAVSVYDWRRITSEHEEATRVFAKVSFAGKSACLALGNPIARESEVDSLYAPLWFLEQLGATGMGDSVEVEWLPESAFPEATRVLLRPHDSAFYHADAKEELECALTRLGVITSGMTITIPLMVLGGYEVSFDVVKTEPANIVLAEGDEVAMEFEEALDAAAAVAAATPRPPTPIPTGPSLLAEEDSQMLPGLVSSITERVELLGQRLGGNSPSTPRFMPDGSRWNPWKHGPWQPAA